jgi:hypothetical protein
MQLSKARCLTCFAVVMALEVCCALLLVRSFTPRLMWYVCAGGIEFMEMILAERTKLCRVSDSDLKAAVDLLKFGPSGSGVFPFKCFACVCACV